jgi:hypothetical protein
MASPIKSRLNLPGWANGIPLKFLWTVDISPRNGSNMASVGRSIKKYIETYDSKSFDISENIIDDTSNKEYGELLAQTIALPNEQLLIETEHLEGTGGFKAGYIGKQRQPYGAQNKLDITFLETNKDLIDNFIKPWIIAVSYKGLIEDGEDDLKCNIDLVLHAKGQEEGEKGRGQGTQTWRDRKRFSFFNAVPYQIEAEQLSYSGDVSIQELSRTVAFTFDYYEVTDLSN